MILKLSYRVKIMSTSVELSFLSINFFSLHSLAKFLLVMSFAPGFPKAAYSKKVSFSLASVMIADCVSPVG